MNGNHFRNMDQAIRIPRVLWTHLFSDFNRGKWAEKQVTGPLDEKVNAAYGISGDGKSAMIEIAAAAGLTLIPEEKLNPLITTTYGVGELILDAIERGCRHFIIGLGGSATNDAGVGMLQALGFQFLNKEKQDVGKGGRVLHDIQYINTDEVHPLLKECTFQVACDVKNYLHGEDGAANVFGPQKGATADIVIELDQGLKHFDELVQETLDMDVHHIEGAGAAGGLGAAFAGFLAAELESGIDLILNFTQMEKYIADADIVITGEGLLDGQTSMGKAPIGVAQRAKKHHIPVIALAGGLKKKNTTLNDLGITASFSILPSPMSLTEAMNPEETFKNLEFTTNQLFRLIKSIGLKR